jgi:CDP-diacylglycerol pyrophosphatase
MQGSRDSRLPKRRIAGNLTMKLGLTGGVLLGAALIGAVLASSAIAGGWSRDALRSVVSACVVAKSTLSVSFPCTDVRLGTPEAEGYALIRSPGFASEFLVTPLNPLDGIGSAELQTDAATGLWNTAWSARSDVAAALGRTLPRSAVALAVNGAGTRTQDHFHIHIDCVRQTVGKALASRAAKITTKWTKFPTRLVGDSYWVRSVASSDLSDTNIARLTAESPPADGATPLDDASVAVVPATLADGSDGFFLLANWSNASAERILDHQCKGR